MISDDQLFAELQAIGKKSPCWDGYVQRGMKPGKDGKPVPNCVPAESKKAEGYQGCGCPECKAENIPCEKCDTCNPAVAKAKANEMWRQSPFFN